MKFTKMHGIGNDYIYFNCFEEKIENPSELAIRLSERHKGVGGDGIVMIMPSEAADFRMRMFNADGSEGKMCGNATRCIGKYVYERGLTEKKEFTLETLSGIKRLSLAAENGRVSSISVDMGKAEFEAKKIPVISNFRELINEECEIAGEKRKITCVSVGNPHCVVFGEEVAELKLDVIGPKYEHDAMFPERVNTEFAEKADENVLFMRVWERGSGETMACGTGACAVVAAAVKCGLADADTFVTVKLLGGDLEIKYCSDGQLIMRGGADFVFDGELCSDML